MPKCGAKTNATNRRIARFTMFAMRNGHMIPRPRRTPKVSGRRYLVDAEGRAVTGWNELNGKMY